MNKKCKKCDKEFKTSFKLDGKWICTDRKYCYDCSPLRSNNRVTLEKYTEVDGEKHKSCTICKKIKPLKDFYTQSYNKRPKSECKSCTIEIQSNKRYSIKLMAIKYKGGRCEDCGVVGEHPAIYDFHHMKGKDYTIGSKIQPYSDFEIIKVELDKCVLLCSNCHRKRHSPKFINPTLE